MTRLISAAAALPICLCLLAALYAPANAETNEELGVRIKAEHQVAARKFFDSMGSGVQLSGSVTENGSPGEFQAYFLGDRWVVRLAFGQMVSKRYSGPEGDWTGTNYSLPYKLEPLDNPASTTLSLLSDGQYLQEPYWSALKFESEDAGGYNFTFSPSIETTDETGQSITTALPTARLVMYSDSSEPQHLQIMSAEVELAPGDPDASTYRSFYYYQQDAQGRIYTQRETGREIDPEGVEASYSDYTVNSVEPISDLPAEAGFSFDRSPAGPALAAPVQVPVNTDSGYFILPVTFEGSDKTWNFIFDSGASASLFTPEAAAAAGLTAEVKVPAHGHGSRVDFEIGLCRTASLGATVATAEQRAPLSPFPAARISESNVDVLSALSQYNAAGILGVSLLNQYVVSFDHLKGMMTVYSPADFDAATDVELPNVEFFLDAEDLVYVMAYVSDGKQPEPLRGEMVLDTGLQQQLALLRETVESRGLLLEKVSERSNTVLGGVKKFDYVTLPRFDIGPLTWNNVETSLTSDDKGTLSGRGILGFLGVPFFWGTKVTIDLFNQRMWVRPTDEEEMQKALKDFQERVGMLPATGDEPASDEEPAAEEKDEDGEVGGSSRSTDSAAGDQAAPGGQQ
jgi:hypothetical protein